MTPRTKKPKPVKARKAYMGIPERDFTCNKHNCIFPPWYVLPSDAASYQQMVEQIAKAYAGEAWHSQVCYVGPYYRKQARAALAAIGIREPK